MSKNNMDPRFLKGGQVTLEKYGADHFRKAQKKSWKAQMKKNRNRGRELAAAGLYTREVKKQNYIKSQLEPAPSLFSRLLGVKNTP